MSVLQGVSEKAFTNGKELQPLLSELIDCASFPKPLVKSQKIKHLVQTEGIMVSDVELATWFKCICLKSQNTILARPNGKTKKDFKLRICLLNLSSVQRTYLLEIMDTADSNQGNQIFLERVKRLLQESLI